jgi:hypothetical protein
MNASCKLLILGVALLLSVPGSASLSLAADPPKSVKIDTLSKYYDAVTFDHAMHNDVADSCATCHHHTAGNPPQKGICANCHKKAEPSSNLACQGCHAAEPFSSTAVGILNEGGKRYHIDVPGLKGAYHLSCLGCHQEMGGPTGCEDCHERNKQGDELFSAGAVKPLQQHD